MCFPYNFLKQVGYLGLRLQGMKVSGLRSRVWGKGGEGPRVLGGWGLKFRV